MFPQEAMCITQHYSYHYKDGFEYQQGKFYHDHVELPQKLWAPLWYHVPFDVKSAAEQQEGMSLSVDIPSSINNMLFKLCK